MWSHVEDAEKINVWYIIWGIFFCVLKVRLEENGCFPCKEKIILIQLQGGGNSDETEYTAENSA